MSNGNGAGQRLVEDQNPFMMVDELLQEISQKFPRMDYSDVVMALMAGAARLSLQFGDSLELFKAQSVVAYEKMGKIICHSATIAEMPEIKIDEE